MKNKDNHEHEHCHDEHCHGHKHCHEHEHCHSHDDACCCGHDHEHSGGVDKQIIVRLAIGLVLSVVILLAPISELFLIIPYLILGYDVLWASLKNIFRGKLFDERFLMSIATIGALLLGEYTEAAEVMFFYQLGELLSDITAESCRISIKEMFDFAPESARRVCDNGFETIKPDELKVGDRIAVFAGEKIPCDGVVYDGNSYMDTAALTGESMLRHVGVGTEVLGGSINTDSPIYVTVNTEYKDSSVAKVTKMLEEASKNKAPAEKFITSFAKRYTPIVVLIALLSAIILPFLPQFTIESGIYTALMFLVISCPCSLVISIPLALFAGIGRASRHKILFRGNNSLEKLRKIRNFAFDKTGTLTEGKFKIRENTLAPEDFALLAQAERYSNHPLASSVAEYATEPYLSASAITEYKGLGISAELNEQNILAGNKKFLELKGIENIAEANATAIHLAINGEYKGYITLTDAPKAEAANTIEFLKRRKAKVTLLSGDLPDAVKQTADEIGISDYHAALLPQDKVEFVRKLQAASPLCYVGDGINDAPVLALSEIGVSMGGVGSDAAIANSDIILLNDNLQSLDTAIKISEKTMRIVYQNIVLSLGIKAAVMILGFMNLASMPMAIFADVGVMIIAIINSIRATR